jgi:hypothetical protein
MAIPGGKLSLFPMVNVPQFAHLHICILAHYSTVTLFAKFRGMSTLMPFNVPT